MKSSFPIQHSINVKSYSYFLKINLVTRMLFLFPKCATIPSLKAHTLFMSSCHAHKFLWLALLSLSKITNHRFHLWGYARTLYDRERSKRKGKQINVKAWHDSIFMYVQLVLTRELAMTMAASSSTLYLLLLQDPCKRCKPKNDNTILAMHSSSAETL